ncbi:MAG: cell division protein FtsQ/DivIB [Planctomycetota bacterium]|jgi:hypothetical protein
MARKKKTRRKTRSRGSRTPWWERLPRPEAATVGRAAIAGAWIALVGGIAGLWSWGVPQLSAYASTHGRPAADIEVRFRDAPAWLRGDLETLLLLTARTHLEGDPMRRDDLVATHAALLNSGWFDAVHQVRRLRPGVVEVEADYVEPYALVRSRGYDHLVDPAARLLPRAYPAGTSRRFTAITGAHFDGPARPGLQWEGADVGAALRLLALIETRPWRHQVEQIDVSRYLREQMLVLVTDRGCRIEWGSAPGEERSLEALADLKRRYLDRHYELSRHIDRGHVGILDLTRREGVFAR